MKHHFTRMNKESRTRTIPFRGMIRLKSIDFNYMITPMLVDEAKDKTTTTKKTELKPIPIN